VTRPTVTALADEVWDELGPVSEPDGDDTGWALLSLLHAFLAPLQGIEDIVRDGEDGEPGWSSVMDPDTCPAGWLVWLGQFYGVRVTPGDPDSATWVAQARDEVRSAAGVRRGTVGAIRAAAQRYLTGTKYVLILERDTSPYHFTVVVRAAEMPALDTVTWAGATGTWDDWPGTWQGKVEAAIRAQKPAGLVMDFIPSDGLIWADETGAWSAATGTWADAL
jgi:hypothetical protein